MSVLKDLFLFSLVSIAVARPSRIEQSAVSSEDEIIRPQLYSKYARAAYCYENFHGTSNNITCSADGGHCLLIEGAETYIVNEFASEGDSKTSGFVAVDHTHQSIIVAIQGTDVTTSVMSAITDVDLFTVKTDLCGKNGNMADGCAVHDGFYRAMRDVADEIARFIEDARGKWPGYGIVATGHSLGGAVAALIGAHLRNHGFIVDIYTYGQPHIGSLDICNHIQYQAPAQGRNYRVTHDYDLVPRLPLRMYGVWVHFYPEYQLPYYDPPDGGKWKVTTVDGSPEGAKDDTTLWWTLAKAAWWSLQAHRNYFGVISKCDGEKGES